MSDFKAKMHKIRYPLGLRPRPRWGSLSRSLPIIETRQEGRAPVVVGGVVSRHRIIVEIVEVVAGVSVL